MFTSNEIRNVEFEAVKRGYNQIDVKAFLRKIAEQIENLEQANAAVEAEKSALANEKFAVEQKMIILAEKVEDYRKDEDSLRTALLSAQRLSDTILKEANENAEIIVNDAKKKAEEILGGTTETIKREKEKLELLKGEVSKFKNNVLSIYKSHLEVLSMIPEFNDKPDDEEEQPSEDAAKPAETAEPEVVGEEKEADNAGAYIFTADSVKEEAPVVSEAAVYSEPTDPEAKTTFEQAFYAPSTEGVSKDPFASFSAAADAPVQPAVEKPIETIEYSLPVSAEPEPVPVTEPAPAPAPVEEPSRFGQLDFGDGFSFSAK